MVSLASSTHGKSRVRIMRIAREADGRHVPRELSVAVMLEGERYARAFTAADNSFTVATDTIRNIANVHARENLGLAAEPFAETLAARVLGLHPGTDRVMIETRETCWSRLALADGAHPHAFRRDGNGTPTVRTVATPADTVTRSGIDALSIMKTTGSGWAHFHRDAFTTLPDTDDRVLATALRADWGWRQAPGDHGVANRRLVDAMLDSFATTYSHSLQDSLWRMAAAALDAVPEVADLALACPNQHYIPIDLGRFGHDNPNAVFTVTEEPHGQIECRVAR